MKATQIAQIAFVVIAALAVHQFVRMTINGEQKRVCTPLCTLKPTYANRNRLAPDFQLPTLDGGQLRLADLRGRAVIMNFWTKTCGPCLDELPALASLAKKLAAYPDIVLLTVSSDETAEVVRATLTSVLESDPPFRVLLDPESKVIHDLYGTRLYPETWFIDPEGVIRARVDGARDWTDPLVIEFARSLQDRRECNIAFEQGAPQGGNLRLCAGLLP